ncbi:MAG: hypothetical protein L6R39_003018 [Caloplaca ligustica]|nr:MAG: hypothetical protein L6R39_003018 [Caloplaca ligustica]
MSLFPRFPSNDVSSLFKLLDDYNTQGGSGYSSAVRAFTPKFDVREHKDSYELQGELPGIDQKDVHIEFADPHTIVIKGHVEREYSSDGAGNARGRITGDVTDSSHRDSSHQPTVEDESAEGKKDQDSKEKKEGEQQKNGQVSKQSDKSHHGRPKYWVAERSIGEFHRAFTFPSRVDQDAVKAKLTNGVLSVTVPKAAEHKAKRIEIES